MDAAQRTVSTNNYEAICGRVLSNPQLPHSLCCPIALSGLSLKDCLSEKGRLSLLILFVIYNTMGPLSTTIANITGVVNTLIPLLLSVAVLLFFWGLVKYIANASDEAAKESGKQLMIWGMIALFVMVAFWGIIGYVQSSLGLTGSVTVSAPPTLDVVP